VPELAEIVPVAADSLGWKADQITKGCFGAQTGSPAVPIIFIRVTAGPDGVLDLCLPLATNVEDRAWLEMAAVNGSRGGNVCAAFFGRYEGEDNRDYLGAFVRIPIPPLLLDARPIAQLLDRALSHLWQASMIFGRYLEYNEDHREPPACDPLSGTEVVPARPADALHSSQRGV
jgi:hypothetical protein